MEIVLEKKASSIFDYPLNRVDNDATLGSGNV
jgi:hypothetical protein